MMENNIKLEPIDIDNVEIKEEKELVIENEGLQWLPTKFDDEESEYYHEFKTEFSQNLEPQSPGKNKNFCDQYTIEYIDESEEYSDDDYDIGENVDYDEVDKSVENVSDKSEFNPISAEKTENIHKEELSDLKVVCQLELNKWINNRYIKRKCPVCHLILANYTIWRNHIEKSHNNSIQESESNYYLSSDNCGTCKKCNQEIQAKFPRYIHSIRYTEAAKLDICICKVCDFRSAKCFCVQKHIIENHPEVVREFKVKESFQKCPICSNIYQQKNYLRFHFFDKHPEEYRAKFRYNCHICELEEFSEEEFFLQHLIEQHKLNRWEELKYRKVFEDKEYIACIKCNNLFSKNDINKLLKHYLKHEDILYWSCRFCSKQIDYKRSPIEHMCINMLRYYNKHCNKADNVAKNLENTALKIKSLQEFEKYIAHVCPFCNAVFSKMKQWQSHLRNVHKIDTLKGMQMKVTSNDNNKLICEICHTLVANSPEQLHAHRFQHLPYKPYKCLNCSIALNSFKVAFKHASNRCNESEEKDIDNIKNIVDQIIEKDIRKQVGIQCSLCDYLKFPDVSSSLKHYKEEHNNFHDFFVKHSDNSMTCKVCHNKFVQHEKRSCFEHIHNHFEEKTFKCTLCLRSYISFKSCYQHMLTVHYAKPLSQQGKEKNMHKTTFFLDKEHKVSHVTLLPQLAKPTIKSHVLNGFAEYISYACPECNEGFATQQNWHIHISTEHSFFSESKLHIKDTEGSLKCPTCDMTMTASITHQQKHKLTHMPYRSFICNLCYTRFNSLGVLYGHFRRVHFAQGTYECPICSEILETAHQRTEHLKNTHPRDEWPPLMCIICYKIFTKKGSLKMHMTTHNENRCKYTCNICGSKIIYSTDFNLHMSRHQREEICDDFNSQSGSKCIPSNKFNERDFNKTKSLGKSSVSKKKKIDAE